MKRRGEFDPRRLDIDAFADQGASLAGEWPLQVLERLSSLVLPEAPGHPVCWHAVGEERLGADRQRQRWVRLGVACNVRMTCQRCLEPVAIALSVERAVRFVATEAEAERLDLESEDDVLATSRRFDLLELVEDELVLALPTVPRHEVCQPPAALGGEAATSAPRANPFEVLRHRNGGG